MVKDRDMKTLFNVLDQRTLIVSGFGYFLGKQSGRLVIKEKKMKIAQYAMSNLDEILVMSRGATVSTSLINEACKRGIKICIWSNSYPNVMISSPQLAAFAEVKRAQFRALDNEQGLELIKQVLASKVDNQASMIKYLTKNQDAMELVHVRKNIPMLEAQSAAIKRLNSDNISRSRTQLLTIEALAARLYWQGFKSALKSDCGFNSRDPRAADAVNIALNYGYAILYSLVWMGVLNAGMEPFAGFLHTDRPGKPSLVLDLSEPFKPRLVDRIIVSILNKRRSIKVEEGVLNDTSRKLISSSIMAELNKREIFAGKRLTMRSIIQSNIYSVASMLKGTGPYERYSIKW